MQCIIGKIVNTYAADECFPYADSQTLLLPGAKRSGNSNKRDEILSIVCLYAEKCPITKK